MEAVRSLALLQKQFQIDYIQPTAEFVTDFSEVADVLELEFGVKGDARGLIGVDGGNNNPVTEFSSARDQVFKKE